MGSTKSKVGGKRRLFGSNAPKGIVDTAFAVKSDHSSLVQVADAICYVYRRHIELLTAAEAWAGEKNYYAGLVARLDRSREKLGRTPDVPAVKFFQQAKHPEWAL